MALDSGRIFARDVLTTVYAAGESPGGKPCTRVSSNRRPLQTSLPDRVVLLTNLVLALSWTTDEADRDRLTDEIEVATANLALVPALSCEELLAKLKILQTRMLELLDPEAPGDTVTLSLMASVVHDIGGLSTLTRASAKPLS